MAPESPSYRSTLDGLFRRRRFGLRPGLEVIQTLLAGLGDPQRRFPSVHITGSKGKGSVAAMTAAILTEHGLKTGLYTSPHLASYRERIRIDGRDDHPHGDRRRGRPRRTAHRRAARRGNDRP